MKLKYSRKIQVDLITQTSTVTQILADCGKYTEAGCLFHSVLIDCMMCNKCFIL